MIHQLVRSLRVIVCTASESVMPMIPQGLVLAIDQFEFFHALLESATTFHLAAHVRALSRSSLHAAGTGQRRGFRDLHE